MKNSTKRIMSSLMVFIMLLGLVMPVFAGGAKNIDPADNTPEIDMTLYVHKLMYTNDPSNKITNNGDPIGEYPEGVNEYDPTEYGNVSFTLYKLNTEEFNKAMKENDGNSITLARLLYDNDKNTLTDKGKGLIEGEGITKTQDTKDPLEFSLKIPKSNKVGSYYLLVESKSPLTVTEKSQPMILQLPINRETESHIYPKNKIEESKRELKFTKYVEKFNKNGEKEQIPFEGAKFKLYKGLPGSGTPFTGSGNEEAVFTSKSDGTFTVQGLKPGNYYLVEIDSDKVDSLDANNTEKVNVTTLASKTAMDNTNNQYVFKVTTDFSYYKLQYTNGKWSEKIENNVQELNDSMKKIYNSEKVKTSKSSNRKSISVFQDVEYSINVNPPTNFSGNDTITIHDTADKDIIIKKDSIKAYTIDNTEIKGAQIEVTGDNTNEVTIKLTVNSFPKNADTINIQPIILKYTASLNKNAKIENTKEFKNNITTSYTINNKQFNEPDGPDKTTTVKTYSKSFKKVNDGLWKTNFVETPLKDAVFRLGREVKYEGNTSKAYFEFYSGGTWVSESIPAKFDEYTTGDDGILKINGLSSKDENGKLIKYFVQEVQAPEGYRINDFDKDNRTYFTIDEDTEASLTEIPKIVNYRTVDAPMTGYEKATITVGVLGTALLISVVALKKDRKKENN